ncbi:hypothetical protein NC652_036911 [Populus alba x Populus x berolinensis]|nr:hypothetical protein NC652_036911 [Populus alba x Populus x berolinensis]
MDLVVQSLKHSAIYQGIGGSILEK